MSTSGFDLRRAALLLVLLVVGVAWGLGTLRPNPKLAPGAQLGEITAALADGGHFALSEHRGEVVVVNFWATWCGPCRKEAPVLSRLHRSGVKVIGLSVDALPLPTVAAKARALGMDYPIALGSAEVTARLGIRAVPTTCVVGKDGTVIETHSGLVGEAQLARAIARARDR
jgi:thiol-disulfide isomerase/thioredoxin